MSYRDVREVIESAARVSWELRAEGKDCCAQRLEQMVVRLNEVTPPAPPPRPDPVDTAWLQPDLL